MPVINEAFFLPITKELDEVEGKLRAGLKSLSPLISTVSSYVLGSEGKRIRPSLLLLSAKLCGYSDDSRGIELASVAEYMHVATLIHDDIVDNASTRRGLPSANSMWGPHISVLAGDFLYAIAIQTLVKDGDLQVLQAFADATVRMAEGEVLELQMSRNLDLTYEEYLKIITCKTAALMAASCRVGALIAKAPEEEVEAMAAFGLNLGIGFQMVDDALDFVGHKERLGKPVGNDLREGKITFPLIHLMQHGPEEDKKRIRKLLDKGALGEEDILEVKGLVEQHRGVQATMEKVRGFLEQAKTSLQIFPHSSSKHALLSMADFVGERDW